jgi:predicted GNAT superfamily acetyltransferase
VTRPGANSIAPRVLLPFLADAPRVYRTDPKRSLAARRRFRSLAMALFAKGYVVTGVAIRDGEPAYVLDRTGDRVFE